MEESLKSGIAALIEYAKKNDKLFVFGGEIYTPEEAEDAMLDHAEDEMEVKELSVEDYLDQVRDCCVDRD
jgi:hypothetical protein